MKTTFLARARRGAALVLCVLLLAAPPAGCGSDPGGKIFRYDIAGAVDSLDPQFATSAAARLILLNLFEGLVVQDSGGEILPGVAASHTVSADRLTYTFTLREDAAWSNGDPVVAGDFVFAFRRIFRDRSPHADKFSAIRGAQAMLDGSTSSLGVTASGDHRLVIELEVADPLFLEKLCDPAAAPCNEAAYTEARGRYGLEQKLVCSNGPFELRAWDNTRLLQLRAGEHYRSERETVAGGVNFYIGRDAADQFLDGKTDLAVLNRDQRDQAGGGVEIQPIQKTVWCVVFNQDHAIWGNALLRQGLASAIDHELLGEQVPAGFLPSTLLVPDAMRVMGKPYRELATVQPPIEYDTVRAKRLFDMGLSAAGMKQLPSSVTINIPEEARSLLNMSELQQGWQRDLAAYINFEVTSASQIQSKLQSGDFQMLVMPMTPADSNISTLLEAFTSPSPQNYFGYRNVIYDELLEAASAQHTPEEAAARYARAETILLSDAVVIPLYFETTYLALANGVRQLEVSPFGDRVCFKYAEKDD